MPILYCLSSILPFIHQKTDSQQDLIFLLYFFLFFSFIFFIDLHFMMRKRYFYYPSFKFSGLTCMGVSYLVLLSYFLFSWGRWLNGYLRASLKSKKQKAKMTFYQKRFALIH